MHETKFGCTNANLFACLICCLVCLSMDPDELIFYSRSHFVIYGIQIFCHFQWQLDLCGWLWDKATSSSSFRWSALSHQHEQQRVCVKWGQRTLNKVVCSFVIAGVKTDTKLEVDKLAGGSVAVVNRVQPGLTGNECETKVGPVDCAQEACSMCSRTRVFWPRFFSEALVVAIVRLCWFLEVPISVTRSSCNPLRYWVIWKICASSIHASVLLCLQILASVTGENSHLWWFKPKQRKTRCCTQSTQRNSTRQKHRFNPHCCWSQPDWDLRGQLNNIFSIKWVPKVAEEPLFFFGCHHVPFGPFPVMSGRGPIWSVCSLYQAGTLIANRNRISTTRPAQVDPWNWT